MKNFGKIISDKDIITKEYLDSKGYISAITSKMVTDALGFTPFDSAAFTKASIKNALGIADWALAANKPSYDDVYLKLTGGTITGNLTVNGKVSASGLSISTATASLTFTDNIIYSNASLRIYGGWSLRLGANATGIQEWTDLKTVLGLGSLAYKNSIEASDISSIAWDKITGKPTTLSGYGITDALVLAPASEHRATTDYSAFATYAYADNGWITSGPALAFPNGNYKGLINIYTGHGENNPPKMWIGGVYGGVQQPWVEVLTDKNQGVMQARGRLGATDANTLFSAGSYEFWGGADTANSPSGYATLLVSRGAANNLYFTSQLLTDAQGHLFSRMNEGGGTDNWRPWRTILDDTNSQNLFAIFSNHIDVSSNADFHHIGYGYPAEGWKEVGPALSFGNSSLYYAQLQTSISTTEPGVYYRVTANGVKSNWYKFVFTKGNYQISSKEFLSIGQLVLHRNAEGGDTYLNYGPAVNDKASLAIYGNKMDFYVGDSLAAAMVIQADKTVLFNGGITLGGRTITNWDAVSEMTAYTDVQVSSTPTFTLRPNQKHTIANFSEYASVEFVLDDVTAGTSKVKFYYIEFIVGTNVPSISFNKTLKWQNGKGISNIVANKTYRIFIDDDLATLETY